METVGQADDRQSDPGAPQEITVDSAELALIRQQRSAELAAIVARVWSGDESLTVFPPLLDKLQEFRVGNYFGFTLCRGTLSLIADAMEISFGPPDGRLVAAARAIAARPGLVETVANLAAAGRRQMFALDLPQHNQPIAAAALGDVVNQNDLDAFAAAGVTWSEAMPLVSLAERLMTVFVTCSDSDPKN